MATFGVEFTVGLPATDDEFDERVDKFYESLHKNFAIVSVDSAWDGDRGSLTVLLGVSTLTTDGGEIAVDIARDAVAHGLHEAGLRESEPVTYSPSARVEQFAS